MTGASGGSVDKSGSATDEGVVTGGGDNDEGLTALDSGRSVAGVILVLVDSQRLASDGGLIYLKEGILGDNLSISGDNGTLLNLEDITGDDFGGLNLLQSTVTENNSLESKGLLEFGDNLRAKLAMRSGTPLATRAGMWGRVDLQIQPGIPGRNRRQR